MTAKNDESAAVDYAEGYSVFQRRTEISGITVFFFLSAWSFAQLWAVVSARGTEKYAWSIGLGIFCGLLFADFASGFVHWAADNWGEPTFPVLGPSFIRPFRHHHVDPVALTHHGFVELNGNNCIVSLTVLSASLSMGAEASAFTFFMAVFWLSVAFWVLMTNQAHAWAHALEVPAPVRWLQGSRILLEKTHHDVHHMSPHDRNYCITNGWMNPVLEALRFFQICEWALTAITGILPVHKQIRISTESSNPQVVDA